MARLEYSATSSPNSPRSPDSSDYTLEQVSTMLPIVGYLPVSPRSSFPPSPYMNSLAEKYSLKPNPAEWGSTGLTEDEAEPDDALHTPDPIRDIKNDRGGTVFTLRGAVNLGCLVSIILGCIVLFLCYPLADYLLSHNLSTGGGFNLGGINASGQLPVMPGNRGLIDVDTPKDAYTKRSYMSGKMLELVFSDEFNVNGRSFYPGDDPYWEAPSLHYWGTNDLEWYDPMAVTTKNGSLVITLSKQDSVKNHNLTYRSGMLQSWNKFCFTGGLVETSVKLPGSSNIHGLWPAVWTMGNLGRAGYGATLEGLWPYSYDSCDVGTLPNQTYPGGGLPQAAVENGDPAYGGVLSYLPGQRLSACTCPGESHPGPIRKNGSYVGRGAPEIDILEGIVDLGMGKVSQSVQWAPFNAAYKFNKTSGNYAIYNGNATRLNPYVGGAYQQTTSGLSVTNQNCYTLGRGCYSTYAVEYVPGFDGGHITWISDEKRAWTIFSGALGPDPLTEIGPRPIPQEPMYIIANLGFSVDFGGIDFDHLQFPATLMIDYIRVYQPSTAKNVGCDPHGYPTTAYINNHMDAYTNFNLTSWKHPVYNQSWPKNKLNSKC